MRVLFLLGLLGFVGIATGATVPSGFTESVVATGITNATAMEFAPDGRLFVAQQTGQLRVIKNGALLATPFVTLSVDSSGERGLLGIAFDPDFETTHWVYLYYTTSSLPHHNRVSRFTANGDVAAAGETVLLDLDDLSATNHNGGALHFGPDGTLFIGVGENAHGDNAQTLANLLGKILRINRDGTIPSNNPFFNTAGGKNRAIWALGLRNPYTFAFQPGTGRLFINDVGESAWEEIDEGIAGSNYGWPVTEGPTANPAYRSPLFAYGHGTGPTTGCAIVGGAFYNPPQLQFPSTYTGKYFFADLCSGWIRAFDPATGTASPFATGISSPVDLHVSQDGSLYYLSRGSNSVYRISYPSSSAPGVLSGSVGMPATTEDLTAEGTSDWAHWGLTVAASFDHKAGVTSQISNYTVVGSATASRFGANQPRFSWTDGTPTRSATNTDTGVYVSGLNRGFQIETPADTTSRTLRVYVGLWQSKAKMVVHLSDGSAPDYVDTALADADGSSTVVYTFTYRAGSSGQKLTVTYTQNASGGNVTLLAATMVSGSDFTLNVTPKSQDVPAGGAVDYIASITSNGGFNGNVGMTVTGLPVGATANFTPPTVPGNGNSTMRVTTAGGTPVGTQPLTIRATSGGLSHTATVNLDVTSGGGSILNGSIALPQPGVYNLTDQGTLDWAHWGLATAASFDHKAGVPPQISNYTVIGPATVFRFGANRLTFSWTDGTPTSSAINTDSGVYVSGLGRGFQIEAPADATSRTLRVYVGLWKSQAKMAAHLSDGSAPDYVDTSLVNADGTAVAIYTFTYRAASSGQKLTVTYTQNSSTGNVTMEAATLTR